MNRNTYLKRITVFFAAVIMLCFSAFLVNAVDGEEEPPQAPTQAEATEVPEAPPVEETDPVAVTEPPTQPYVQAETEPVPDETEPVENAEAEQQDETAYEYSGQPTEAVKQLPTIPVVTEKKENTDNGGLTYGYVSWACVAVGIIVLVAVLASTKRTGRNNKNKRR